MRLIDADALNELLEHHERTLLYNVKHGNSNKSRDFIMGVEDGYYRVQSDLKWIPTVDAVEVVRCKDCIYGEDAKGVAKGVVECKRLKMVTKGDWFCAEGRRNDK